MRHVQAALRHNTITRVVSYPITITRAQVNPGEGKVGTRKRSRATKGYMAEDLSDGLGTIPLERSMVLSSSSGSSFAEDD